MKLTKLWNCKCEWITSVLFMHLRENQKIKTKNYSTISVVVLLAHSKRKAFKIQMLRIYHHFSIYYSSNLADSRREASRPMVSALIPTLQLSLGNVCIVKIRTNPNNSSVFQHFQFKKFIFGTSKHVTLWNFKGQNSKPIILCVIPFVVAFDFFS